MEYEAVIGLETHVQLKTRSKMWCGCPNQFGAPPNTLVCPVCLGLPGVLPVPNEEAIRLTLLTGMLLNCELPSYAKFDRKSYFYPDMPKNYQITQYDRPSTRNGYVEFEFEGRVVRVEDFPVPPRLRLLYAFLCENRYLVGLTPTDEAFVSILRAEILAKIQRGDPDWEAYVPPPVAAVIKRDRLFGYRPPVTESEGATEPERRVSP